MIEKRLMILLNLTILEAIFVRSVTVPLKEVSGPIQGKKHLGIAAKEFAQYQI